MKEFQVGKKNHADRKQRQKDVRVLQRVLTPPNVRIL